MSDIGPRDRQDLPIWNAIEANNFKQALKLVDKRLAKKQSDYLEVCYDNYVFSQWDHITLIC